MYNTLKQITLIHGVSGKEHRVANGIKEIIAGAFDDNIASLRVMQKCGMILMDKTEEIEYCDRVHRCIYYHITND